MLEDLHPARPLITRLRLGGDESPAAPYLRAILAFVAEVPAVGWVLKGSKEALSELSEEADDATLEERFQALFDIGGQTNERVALLAAVASAIFEQNSLLLEFLRVRELPVAPEPLERFAREAALVAYRNRVANEFRYADHRGIEGVTRQAHVAALPLDDVYVLPRFVPEVAQATEHARERDLLRRLLGERDLAPQGRAELEAEFAVLTGERWKQLAKQGKEGVPLAHVMESTRHSVVIGSPGVGKSTLTRFLARACALGGEAMRERLGWEEPLVPVRLPLALFAEARRSRPQLTLREYLHEVLAERGGEALCAAFGEALAAGDALVLLDGVDEVSESHARAALVQAEDAFLADHERARVLATSRPYGYVRLRGTIPHFTLPNFSDDHVKEFVERWQRAYEVRQHPDAPDFARAQEEAKALLAEIGKNARVKELATNPLMLVIVSLVRYERTRLPEERVQLYHRAVNTLMDTWNQWRSQLGQEAGGVLLPLDRLVRVWGAVAEWTRRERNTGVVHKAELRRKLVEVLRDREYADRDAEETADAYLRAAADRAGILEERGQDVFAFWHPTFEEFLAAVELATPTSQAVRKLLPLLDDPRWREVVLLAVGYIGVVQRDPDTASEVVEAILEQELPAEEPVLHGRLRLAAACVMDDVGVRRSLKERVVVELARAVAAHPVEPLTSAFEDITNALGSFRLSREGVAALAPLMIHSDFEARDAATWLLSNAADDDPAAFSLCQQALEDSSFVVRATAALPLARRGQFTTQIWRALLQGGQANAELLLTDPEAPRHFGEAVELDGFVTVALKGLAPLLERDGRFVLELERLLRSPHPRVQLGVAEVLIRWNPKHTGARDALIAILESGSDWSYYAVEAMLRLNILSDVTQPFLTKHADARGTRQAGTALWIRRHLEGPGIELYRDALSLVGAEELGVTDLHRLSTWGNDESFRRLVAELLNPAQPITSSAAWTILTWWDATSLVTDAQIMEFLQLEDEGLRLRAAQESVSRGGDTQAAIKTLYLLLSSEDEEIRTSACHALLDTHPYQLPLQATITALLGSEDEWITYAAIMMVNDYKTIDIPIREAIWSYVRTAEDGVLRDDVETILAAEYVDRELLELWAKTLTREPWSLLACCEKILNNVPLSPPDAQLLADVTAQRDDQEEEVAITRRCFRSWIWARMEPDAAA